MFCALLMSRYQVSVYRTNGPLVFNIENILKHDQIYGQVQIRIQIVGARIYQAVIPKVLKIPD